MIIPVAACGVYQAEEQDYFIVFEVMLFSSLLCLVALEAHEIDERILTYSQI
jgi:hypothetical protein